MKKNKPEILVLFGGGKARHLELIEEELKKLNQTCLFSNYKQLIYHSKEKTQSPKLLCQGHDLKDFKVIFYRLIGPRWELVTLINTYLTDRIKENKVKLIDPLAVSLKRYYGLKLSQTLALKQAGLPIPRTVWGHLKELEAEITVQLGFPAIVKRSGGSHGSNVYLAQDKNQLSQILEKLKPQETKENKRFIGQEFIPNQGDLRVLVLGDITLGAIKRQRTNDQFRNNVSQGGRATVVKKLPEKIEKIAQQAASAVDLSFAGVDIVLREGDQEPFILEVNRSPQFGGFMKASKMNVPEKIARFLVDQKEQVK